MRRIGIVTLYKDNFGSILQAYSTYSAVRSLGYCCELIERNDPASIRNQLKKVPAVICKCLRYPSYFMDRRKGKAYSKYDAGLLSAKTKKLMDEFIQDHFNIYQVSSDSLREIRDRYVYVIAGSDQVWNGYDPFRFLTFAEKEQRIAFAPSFGGTIKDYHKETIRKALLGFDTLSAREESGVTMMKELTGKAAVRLADPTLLLSKKEWEAFAANGTKKENYILLHFLNEPNELAIKTIHRYLISHDCSVFCICNEYEVYNQLTRHRFVDINPYDYVSLISRAALVFTDSFHSTLFSLILETQFLTFERQYSHGNSQSDRITELLNRVHMQNRYVTTEGIYGYEKQRWQSDALFFYERKTLREYLEKAFSR